MDSRAWCDRARGDYLTHCCLQPGVELLRVGFCHLLNITRCSQSNVPDCVAALKRNIDHRADAAIERLVQQALGEK